MTQFEYHNTGNDESAERRGVAYLFAQVSIGKAVTGVLSGLSVAQTTTASASVVIAAGGGVIHAATVDGASLVAMDSPLTLDVLGANPMGGLPRNDLIVYDLDTLTPITGTATGGVRVVVGTPNASPTDPTAPGRSLVLARLRHAASATTVPTAKIDDLRTYTTLAEYAPPWSTLTLAGGVSGTLKYRVRGTEVDVAVDVTGTFAAGFTAISAAGAIPAANRPSITPARAVAYIGSGTVQGSIEVTTAGTINLQCDASRTVGKALFSYSAG